MRGSHIYTGRIRPASSRAPAGAAYNRQGRKPLHERTKRTGTPPAAIAGERERAGDIKRGFCLGGDEELVSLVMKTALASGMKNSLVLVVKNGLRPW